jgi:hypothetical protein
MPNLSQDSAAGGTPHTLYSAAPAGRYRAYRDATACVLLEHGFSPRIADRTGAVVISR